MSHYSQSMKYLTKKSLKEAVNEDPNKVELIDPSVVGSVSGTVPEILEKKSPITVTNHPTRSWFAQIKKATRGKNKGKIVVT